jgi:hypothetical protein
MKTLVRSTTNESLFLLSDETYLFLENDKTIIGDPIQNIVLDCNNKNTIVYTNVTPPEDWIGCKYLYDGTTWTVNPDYIQIT